MFTTETQRTRRRINEGMNKMSVVEKLDLFNKNARNRLRIYHSKGTNNPSISVKTRRKLLKNKDLRLQRYYLAFRLDFFEIKASASEILFTRFPVLHFYYISMNFSTSRGYFYIVVIQIKQFYSGG